MVTSPTFHESLSVIVAFSSNSITVNGYSFFMRTSPLYSEVYNITTVPWVIVFNSVICISPDKLLIIRQTLIRLLHHIVNIMSIVNNFFSQNKPKKLDNIRKSLLLTLEFPPQKGGTQKYYLSICRNLPSDKIVVLTTSQKSKVKSQKFSNEDNFKVYRRNLLSKLIWPHWLPMFLHLWRIIKKENIKLIQVGQVLPCGTAALIIKKIFKIPYIVYTHGLDILGPQKNPRKLKLMKKILKEAEHIVSNSNFTKNEVIKLGIEESKVVVVYPSVQNQESRIKNQELLNNIKNKYNLNNKKVLLTVCRLVKRKGVDHVLDALRQVGEKLQDVVYVVVGDGLERERLEQQAEALRAPNGLSEPVIFAGRVSDEELKAWYIIADVLILTPQKSDYDVEGFGIVYIEANSYGKPVIGSKLSGIVEAIEDRVSGILVDSNVKEIGQAIVQLFNDEELRERLGKQGRERAHREFNIDRQMDRLKKVLI